MMHSIEIKKSLLNSTILVFKVIVKDLSLKDFIKEYGNFYYYEALDGHEADETQKKNLDELKMAIQLHEKVQTQVIDLLYLEEANKEQYMEAGRIDGPEALKRLAEIGEEYNIREVIKQLGG